jgi:hypothetical protein
VCAHPPRTSTTQLHPLHSHHLILLHSPRSSGMLTSPSHGIRSHCSRSPSGSDRRASGSGDDRRDEDSSEHDDAGMLTSPSQGTRRHCSRNTRSRSPTRPSGSGNHSRDEDRSEHEDTSDTDVIEDSSQTVAARHEITAATIWDGYVVVEPSHVESFDQDLGCVLTASEALSYRIHAVCVEENDASSRRLMHEAALRVADVLTPRHQEVPRSLREFERRATICPLCMTRVRCKDAARDHLESKEHLLQVRQHHEQRGWVKIVPILIAALPLPVHRSRAR